MFEGTPSDIFQGDIFQPIELMHPKPGHLDSALMPAIVVSHDCEWTKVEKWGTGYCLLIAPLREVQQFETGKGEAGHIRSNRIRFLFALPHEAPIETEFAVDFTRIQPVTVAELLEAELWTSIGLELKSALQGALVSFFSGRKLFEEAAE